MTNAKGIVETLREVANELPNEQDFNDVRCWLVAASVVLEEVARERDAAIEDIRGRCYACANARSHEKHPNLNTCEYLSAAVAVGGYGKTKCDKWQWRGNCAENGGLRDGTE